MTIERPRGNGTHDEIQQMLVEVGQYFRDSTEYPNDGLYMYGEGGVLVWKLLSHLEDIFPFKPLTHFPDLGPHSRFGLIDILGFTQGVSLAEDSFLADVINRSGWPDIDAMVEREEVPDIWVNEIGKSRDTPIAPEGTPIFLVREEDRFTVAKRGASSGLDYKYIYRGQQWMTPVLEGRFDGARVRGRIRQNEGLYWNIDWTPRLEYMAHGGLAAHQPQRISGPAPSPLAPVYAAISARRLASSGRDMISYSVFLNQRPSARYIWGYVPIEDITMIDYARMHLLANRTRVIGLMDSAPIGTREIARNVSQTVYALSPSDTTGERFIPLVEFLQNVGWI